MSLDVSSFVVWCRCIIWCLLLCVASSVSVSVSGAEEIPMVFIYLSAPCPDYMKASVVQSAQTNSRVYVIGDKVTPECFQDMPDSGNKITIVSDMAPLMTAANAFDKVFVHMHHSNTREFELWCFQRWFILHAFMKQYNLQRIFYVDSDVLMFTDVSQTITKHYSDCHSMLSVDPESWKQENYMVASGHSSLWSQEVLGSFCDYCMATYSSERAMARIKGKWDWHKSTGAFGGVCDMSVLWLFYLDNLDAWNGKKTIDRGIIVPPNHHVCDGFSPRDGQRFDHNKNVEPAIWYDPIKSLPFMHDGDMTYRMLNIHFQGGAKGQIREDLKNRPQHKAECPPPPPCPATSACPICAAESTCAPHQSQAQSEFQPQPHCECHCSPASVSTDWSASLSLYVLTALGLLGVGWSIMHRKGRNHHSHLRPSPLP